MVWYAVLLLGTCLTMPYLQDYDLVFGAMIVAWLWQQPVESDREERALQIAWCCCCRWSRRHWRT